MRVRPNLTAFRLHWFSLPGGTAPEGRIYPGRMGNLLVFDNRKRGHRGFLKRVSTAPHTGPEARMEPADARIYHSPACGRCVVFTIKRLKLHGFLRQGNAPDIARRRNAAQ